MRLTATGEDLILLTDLEGSMNAEIMTIVMVGVALAGVILGRAGLGRKTPITTGKNGKLVCDTPPLSVSHQH